MEVKVAPAAPALDAPLKPEVVLVSASLHAGLHNNNIVHYCAGTHAKQTEGDEKTRNIIMCIIALADTQNKTGGKKRLH